MTTNNKHENSAIIGISLGNSYFNEETVTDLIEFCQQNYPNTLILINDVPAVHNFIALGHDRKKATKKARLNGNRIRNLLSRVTTKLNAKDVTVLDWHEDIFSNPDFEKAYSYLLSLYFDKGDFHDAVRETTLSVLQPKLSQDLISKQAVDEAVHYLLKELAFLLHSPSITNSESTSYVYHDSWPIYEKLITGSFDDVLRKDLRFVLFP